MGLEQRADPPLLSPPTDTDTDADADADAGAADDDENNNNNSSVGKMSNDQRARKITGPTRPLAATANPLAGFRRRAEGPRVS